MAEVTVILWRDIPAQVTCGSGRRAVRAVLSDRFQEAIDAAAMGAGLFGADGYLEEWRREAHVVEGDDAVAVAAEVERLETLYTDDSLAQLVRRAGLREGGSQLANAPEAAASRPKQPLDSEGAS